MGILRFVLALSVVSSHIGDFYIGRHLLSGPSGGMAVNSFFVISGFYMALIMKKYQLNQQLSWQHIKIFYINRALRIYPLYIIGLIIVLFHSSEFFHNISLLHVLWQKFFYIFSNIFIFGIDILKGLYFSNANGLTFFPVNTKFVYGGLFLINGVAWTLSIELMFYVIVPFIIRRGVSFIIFLLIIFWVYANSNMRDLLHIPKYMINLSDVLYLFLLGIVLALVVYPKIQLLKPILVKFSAWGGLLILLFIFPVFYYFHITFMHIDDSVYIWFLIIVLPFLFQHFKNNKIDRWIGLFSYPMYILHLPLVWIVAPILSWKFFNNIPLLNYGLKYALILILILIPVILFIEIPIDRFRHRFIKTKQ